MPNTNTPSISSEVAIGRRMNGSEMLIAAPPPARSFAVPVRALGEGRVARVAQRDGEARLPVRTAEPARQPFEVEIDDRRRVQRQPLRDEQPADDRDAEPAPCPSAIGKEPNSAAKVVIMIGRKRSRQASWIAACGVLPSTRSACKAKSIIMIAFFLTMPTSRMTPIIAMTLRS